MSAVFIFAMLEAIIGWFMKGRGLWSFYKDLKKWIETKKEKKEAIENDQKLLLRGYKVSSPINPYRNRGNEINKRNKHHRTRVKGRRVS